MYLVIKAPKGAVYKESPYNGVKFRIEKDEIAVNLSAVPRISIAENTLDLCGVAIHFTDGNKAREVYENILHGSAKIEVSAGIESVQIY